MYIHNPMSNAIKNKALVYVENVFLNVKQGFLER